MYTKRNLLDSQGFEDFVVLRSVISLPNQYNLQERTLSRLRRLWLITMKKIGIVGVGCISGIYLENITKRFRDIEIIGVCDLIRERAENAVKNYHIPKLYADMHELFADPEVDIVLNITRPYEHYEVSRAALLAGKHVYSEKLVQQGERGSLAVDLVVILAVFPLAEHVAHLVGQQIQIFFGNTHLLHCLIDLRNAQTTGAAQAIAFI
jgi:hypothetical protein